MEIMDMVVLGLLICLALVLWILMSKNAKLSSENQKLHEILEVKDVTISNYEASRMVVKDVVENFSSFDTVMKMIHEGESKEQISKTLGMPLSKIELILKFDKLKTKNSAKVLET